MVPLGLFFAKQTKKQQLSPLEKKLAAFAEDDNDAAPKSPTSQQIRGPTQHKRIRNEKINDFATEAKAAERADEKSRMEACVKSKDLKGAEACLGTLVQKGYEDTVCYNMVISLCAKLGQMKQADKWMQRMLDAGVRPDVASFNSTIDAFARDGDVAGAERWLKRMENFGIGGNTITYNAVINACARAHDIPQAQWWLSQLCKTGTP